MQIYNIILYVCQNLTVILLITRNNLFSAEGGSINHLPLSHLLRPVLYSTLTSSIKNHAG